MTEIGDRKDLLEKYSFAFSSLYGTNIINLTEDNINKLYEIENSVYRSILGSAHYSSNVTHRG